MGMVCKDLYYTNNGMDNNCDLKSFVMDDHQSSTENDKEYREQNKENEVTNYQNLTKHNTKTNNIIQGRTSMDEMLKVIKNDKRHGETPNFQVGREGNEGYYYLENEQSPTLSSMDGEEEEEEQLAMLNSSEDEDDESNSNISISTPKPPTLPPKIQGKRPPPLPPKKGQKMNEKQNLHKSTFKFYKREAPTSEINFRVYPPTTKSTATRILDPLSSVDQYQKNEKYSMKPMKPFGTNPEDLIHFLHSSDEENRRVVEELNDKMPPIESTEDSFTASDPEETEKIEDPEEQFKQLLNPSTQNVPSLQKKKHHHLLTRTKYEKFYIQLTEAQKKYFSLIKKVKVPHENCQVSYSASKDKLKIWCNRKDLPSLQPVIISEIRAIQQKTVKLLFEPTMRNLYLKYIRQVLRKHDLFRQNLVMDIEPEDEDSVLIFSMGKLQIIAQLEAWCLTTLHSEIKISHFGVSFKRFRRLIATLHQRGHIEDLKIAFPDEDALCDTLQSKFKLDMCFSTQQPIDYPINFVPGSESEEGTCFLTFFNAEDKKIYEAIRYLENLMSREDVVSVVIPDVEYIYYVVTQYNQWKKWLQKLKNRIEMTPEKGIGIRLKGPKKFVQRYQEKIEQKVVPQIQSSMKTLKLRYRLTRANLARFLQIIEPQCVELGLQVEYVERQKKKFAMVKSYIEKREAVLNELVREFWNHLYSNFHSMDLIQSTWTIQKTPNKWVPLPAKVCQMLEERFTKTIQVTGSFVLSEKKGILARKTKYTFNFSTMTILKDRKERLTLRRRVQTQRVWAFSTGNCMQLFHPEISNAMNESYPRTFTLKHSGIPYRVDFSTETAWIDNEPYFIKMIPKPKMKCLPTSVSQFRPTRFDLRVSLRYISKSQAIRAVRRIIRPNLAEQDEYTVNFPVGQIPACTEKVAAYTCSTIKVNHRTGVVHIKGNSESILMAKSILNHLRLFISKYPYQSPGVGQVFEEIAFDTLEQDPFEFLKHIPSAPHLPDNNLFACYQPPSSIGNHYDVAHPPPPYQPSHHESSSSYSTPRDHHSQHHETSSSFSTPHAPFKIPESSTSQPTTTNSSSPSFESTPSSQPPLHQPTHQPYQYGSMLPPTAQSY